MGANRRAQPLVATSQERRRTSDDPLFDFPRSSLSLVGGPNFIRPPPDDAVR